MFTGLVEEVGVVAAVTAGGPGAVLAVTCETVLADTRPGDSISVNGCCLTVTRLDGRGFVAEVMGETLERTALGALGPGDPVNLERALRADGRLGGHLVQGHVDAVGEVTAVDPRGQWTAMTVSAPPAVAPYLVEKGSVTVDGTALTVMRLDGAGFQVGLIPHTLAATVLGRRRPGDRVNLEADIVAKYVQRLLRAGATTPYDPRPPAAPAAPPSPRAPRPPAAPAAPPSPRAPRPPGAPAAPPAPRDPRPPGAPAAQPRSQPAAPRPDKEP